jgi:hypothetical protein
VEFQDCIYNVGQLSGSGDANIRILVAAGQPSLLDIALSHMSLTHMQYLSSFSTEKQEIRLQRQGNCACLGPEAKKAETELPVFIAVRRSTETSDTVALFDT